MELLLLLLYFIYIYEEKDAIVNLACRIPAIPISLSLPNPWARPPFPSTRISLQLPTPQLPSSLWNSILVLLRKQPPDSLVSLCFLLPLFYFTFASSYYLFDGLANILTLLLLNHFYLWNWSLLPLWRPPVSSLFAVYEFELLWPILQTNIHIVDVWFHPFLLNACWSFSWRDIHPRIETPIC